MTEPEEGPPRIGPLFDSHCHLTDPRFGEDRGPVIERARAAGVEEIVTVGTHPEDAAGARAAASSVDGLWCTAGLHPHEADRFGPGTIEALEEVLAAPEAVAVGETGLDYHYDNAPRERQRASFRAHLEAARRLEMPLVVHSRDADRDTARLVDEYADRVTGVLHCFTGGDDLLERALAAGWYVSFSGIVTFGSFDAPERVRRVPADRLMVETDSPYLAPVPERGGRNEPAFVAHTCRRVAEMRDEDPSDVAARTRANARRFYRLEGA